MLKTLLSSAIVLAACVGLCGEPSPVNPANSQAANAKRIDKEAAKELADYYAANPDAALAHTNAATVTKLAGVILWIQAEDAAKKIKDKADKAKEKGKQEK